MLNANDIEELKQDVQLWRGLPTAAYGAILKKLLKAAQIDIEDFLCFSRKRLDSTGTFLLRDRSRSLQIVMRMFPDHFLAEDKIETVTTACREIGQLEHFEAELFNRLSTVLRALRMSVKRVKEHVAGIADLDSVNHELEGLRLAYLECLGGHGSLQHLLSSISGSEEGYSDFIDNHLAPLGRSGNRKEKTASICCQINMTCETDAPSKELSDLLDGRETKDVVPIISGGRDLDLDRERCSPQDLKMAENHLLRHNGMVLLYLVSKQQWYRLSDEAAEFLSVARSKGCCQAINDILSVGEAQNTLVLLAELIERKILVFQEKGEKNSEFLSPAINALQLHLTHHCNMACSYCYAGGGSYGEQPTEMSLETAMKAVDLLIARAGESPTLKLSFFGGEPLLRLDIIKKIIPYARKKATATSRAIEFSLTTNGLLLDKEAREYLHRENVGILLSLDGPREVHDKRRLLKDGSGSYSTIIDNLFSDTGSGSGIKIRGTHVSHEDDLEKVYQHLNSLPVAGGFVYHRANPGSAYFDQAISHHKEWLEKEVAALRSKAGIRLSPFFKTLRQIDTRDFSGRPCGGGRNFLAVAPDGELFFCHRFVSNSAFSMGSVWNDPCSVKQYPSPAVEDREECKECWARYHCGGQCYFECDAVFGDVAKPDPGYCAHTKSLIECGALLAAEYYHIAS